MEQSQFWEAKIFSTIQEIPLYFMESEDSLPHLQEPNTCSYFEPDQFYAEIFWSLYSVILKIISLILKLIKPDPEVCNCWYCIIYRLIIMFLQADTEIYIGW